MVEGLEKTRVVYDIETYPNIFLFSGRVYPSLKPFMFEISDTKNELDQILQFLRVLRREQIEMVGFNSIMFDYPVLHRVITQRLSNPMVIYKYVQELIESQNDGKTYLPVPPQDWLIPQVDLFRIHHFHNKNKSASLKTLEFVMRLPVLQDLPFEVGKTLDSKEKEQLKFYNMVDVDATIKFFEKSVSDINLREELSRIYGKSFINHDNAKIGADILLHYLLESGYCPWSPSRGRLQTIRSKISIADILLKDFSFQTPEFSQILKKFKTIVVEEMTTPPKDLSCKVNGAVFVFGFGGIHATIPNTSRYTTDGYVIIDVDAVSFYASIAIKYKLSPGHITKHFPEVYEKISQERQRYKKGTPRNKALKEGLVSIYGKSNDRFSPFYDRQFQLTIAINGQLLLLSLIDKILIETSAQLIQANTDGMSFYIHSSELPIFEDLCSRWETWSGLTLEKNFFTSIHTRDVNNYIGILEGGKTKAIGVYKTERDWDERHSMMVVPHVARLFLSEGKPIRETLRNWPDPLDFMILGKAPRGSYLILEKDGATSEFGRYCRYYVSKKGGKLYKIMPPLSYQANTRKIGQCAGWTVDVLNVLPEILTLESLDIDFEFYAMEVEKICLSLV